MAVVTRRDSPYYWLTLERPNAPPVRRATRIRVRGATPRQTRENRRLAEIEYHAQMAALARGRLDLPGAARVPTVAQFFTAQYRPWLVRARPRTAAETIRRLKGFLPLIGTTPLDEVRPDRIETWRQARRAVSAQTLAREVSDLRGMLSKAVEWDVVPRHPLAGLRLDAAPSREVVRYLTTDEEASLLAALDARDTAAREARARYNAHRQARGRTPLPDRLHFADWLTPAVLVALHTGLRRGELLALRWRDLDTHTRTLTVEWTNAKTRRQRRVPLNRVAWDALARWRTQHSPSGPSALVFPGRQGQRATPPHVRALEDVLTAAGIANFRPWHDLRHTFASRLVQRGQSLMVVSRLLGHGSVRTTMRYAHLAPEQLREAVDVLAG